MTRVFPQMPPSLVVAARAAMAAGEIILQKRFHASSRVKTHPRDIVTDADEAAEKIIIRHLRAAFPADAILGEEGGLIPPRRGTSRFTWIIDPIDGTLNYVAGKSTFGVMIARCRGPRTIAGLVYFPVDGMMLWAADTKGAWVNDQKIPRALATSFSRSRPIIVFNRTSKNFQGMMHGVRKWCRHNGTPSRSMHSCASNVRAMLVERRRDWHIANFFFPWDAAPLDILLREAGYSVTTFHDAPFSWRTPASFLAAPPSFVPRIQKLLRDQGGFVV